MINSQAAHALNVINTYQCIYYQNNRTDYCQVDIRCHIKCQLLPLYIVQLGNK